MSPAHARTRRRDRILARPGLIAFAVLVFLALASAGAGLGIGIWQTVCRDCPSIAQIYVWEPQQSSKIFARDGQLIAELFLERRTPIALEDLPEFVPQAVIAIEDKRFYRHSGLDYIRIIGSAVQNVLSGRIAAGASTITQQLARNMFAADIAWLEEIQGDVTFWRRVQRKLKEARVARELEKVYTKDQILEAYLNQINFGHGWYGIETASSRYFGKSAANLNPAEAALLASAIKMCASCSPFRDPEGSRNRRNLVLDLMAEQGYLTRDEARRWKEHPIPEQSHGLANAELAPYFTEWVRGMLDARYGTDLYRSGLRIYTTLDVEMQRRAVAAMEYGWERIESTPGYRHPKYADVMAQGGGSRDGMSPYLQGMFIALDPHTGEIRALIGGRDFSDAKFNRAVQAVRQPGSSFKPFVYTAALASGIPASHVIFDTPITLPEVDGTFWSPRNFNREFQGPMTLRQALRESTNVVAVKLGLEVGLETVAQTARRMGIETNIPRVPSMSLGSADVIPIQMAEAYATIATGGIRVRPRPILRVEDAHGRVLWETRPDSVRVLDPITAALIRDMLQEAVDFGTGTSIRNPAIGNLPPEIPAAGKTGTTSESTDVWFIGFTPDLLAAVWFGFDRPTQITSNATGGGMAAPVWGHFMRSVYVGDPPLLPTPAPWELPPEIRTYRVDRESGKLANEWCPGTHVYVEKFAPGTVPTEVCDIHGPGQLRGAPLRGIFDLLPDEVEPTTPDSTIPDSVPTGADAATAPQEVPSLPPGLGIP